MFSSQSAQLFLCRSTLSLIDWAASAGESTPTAISKVAAGSSSIGAHSMAVDRSGRLYGWGVAYAVGAGVVKAITTPTRLAVGTIRDPLNAPTTGAAADASDAAGDDDIDYAYYEDPDDTPSEFGDEGIKPKYTAAEHREVVDVACGGGFSVCVTKSGHVYTWGVWAHGRLGAFYYFSATTKQWRRFRSLRILTLYCFALYPIRVGSCSHNSKQPRKENSEIPAAPSQVH